MTARKELDSAKQGLAAAQAEIVRLGSELGAAQQANEGLKKEMTGLQVREHVCEAYKASPATRHSL